MPSYKKIINNLIDKNISVSIAESFTGGGLSKIFTDTPGISKIFNIGLITYSNNSKNLFLNIPLSTIKKYGAVSKEVAVLMSKNLSKISKSNLCIATTGIAGPSGGTKIKPVGLGYISIIFFKKNYTFKIKLKGSRLKIQKDAIKFCFDKIDKLN
tara:strand:- start:811 stop:1275 length:465 start_codon:yes stop_codon:yes gene_type:complete